jgi:hypothetical protein
MLPVKTDTRNGYNAIDRILKTYLALFLFSCHFVFAQSEIEKKKIFPTAAVALQYAGSIGWVTTGYFRQSANKKVELGLLYGYTPESLGGEIHSFALKFIYEPFKINTEPGFQIEPVQTGLFITQNFSNNLSWTWSKKYDRGYYWWTNSLRFHLFLGPQVSYMFNAKVVDKISFYFEANTNDLYVFSYFANDNARSLSLYDIIFFGVGSKVYFK